ncbi:MAG: hypothetical protein JW844_07615 [Candidatus Omnitrophica bacterium]|nr:hypothetical protein [Candidatus Omnitrophota bacterium]
MLAGILLIITGIMIAVYPQLLSLIVASFLMIAGTTLLLVRYHLRRLERSWNNPFMEFFIRF